MNKLYLAPCTEEMFAEGKLRSDEPLAPSDYPGYFAWDEKPTGPEGARYITHEEWEAIKESYKYRASFFRLVHPKGSTYVAIFEEGKSE